jgi:hypothetical protein
MSSIRRGGGTGGTGEQSGDGRRAGDRNGLIAGAVNQYNDNLA